MKTATPVTLLALAFTLAACAHGTMRGSVAMKISEEEAHVCLGANEVKAGDTVAFFKNVCPHSVVRANPGVTFQEGTLVEKE